MFQEQAIAGAATDLAVDRADALRLHLIVRHKTYSMHLTMLRRRLERLKGYCRQKHQR